MAVVALGMALLVGGCARPRPSETSDAGAAVATPTAGLSNGLYAVVREAPAVVLDTSAYVPLILEAPPVSEDDAHGRPLLSVTLARRYVKLLEDFTRAHLGGKVAIVLGGEIVTIHKVRAVIEGGRMQITRCTDRACDTIRTKLEVASPPHAAATSTTRPTITLAHDAADEATTRRQLDGLFDRYDLSPWMLAPSVTIDRDATPHSHPVLTLHTRHLKDDLLLLSTLLHEEGHWYFAAHADATAAAVAELREAFPGISVGFPDGAVSVESSYEHLLVIVWEEGSMRDLVGELAARQVMDFWANDHYRAIYRAVLERSRDVREVMKRHGLSVPRARDVTSSNARS